MTKYNDGITIEEVREVLSKIPTKDGGLSKPLFDDWFALHLSYLAVGWIIWASNYYL